MSDSDQPAAAAATKQTQPNARSQVYTAPTSGKGGLKRKVKPSHERNKPGVPRSRKIKGDKFDANITKRGTGSATNKKAVREAVHQHVLPRPDQPACPARSVQAKEEESGPTLSPYLVGLFIFLVIGSGACLHDTRLACRGWCHCPLLPRPSTAIFQIISQSQGSLLG